MSQQWFSNRGQMVQVGCAVVGLAIGILLQWHNLRTAIDLTLILTILAYPIGAYMLIQLGKDLQLRASKRASAGEPYFTTKVIKPTIKIGGYVDLEMPFSMKRISVTGLTQHTVYGKEVPIVALAITGAYLFCGAHVRKIDERHFEVPQSTRAMKSEIDAIFEFSFQDDIFTFTGVSVDHINAIASEVTLVVCALRYSKNTFGLSSYL